MCLCSFRWPSRDLGARSQWVGNGKTNQRPLFSATKQAISFKLASTISFFFLQKCILLYHLVTLIFTFGFVYILSERERYIYIVTGTAIMYEITRIKITNAQESPIFPPRCFYHLFGCQFGWLVDWLVDRLVGWLIGWLHGLPGFILRFSSRQGTAKLWQTSLWIMLYIVVSFST